MTVDPHAYLGYGFVFDREPHEAAFVARTGAKTFADAVRAFAQRHSVRVVATEDRVYVVHPQHYHTASWEPERCGVLLALSPTWGHMGYAAAALNFLPPEARAITWILWADTTTIED